MTDPPKSSATASVTWDSASPCAKSPLPPEQRALIRLVDVYKKFGPVKVFAGLNLRVRQRESVVILGPSGTGKSVLLKHIAGLMKPDAGEVHYCQYRVDTSDEHELEEIRRHMGFLFQSGALFDSLSVFENVAFALREHTRLKERDIRERVAGKLAMVGLDGKQALMPSELSGGMRKRVALARAIALDPEVMLYDEPTTGLDPIRADVINELILKLNDELHVTSVVVTHDINSAYKVADRLVMLWEGKVVMEGKPDDFRHASNDEVRRFIQGRASAAELEGLRRPEPPPLPGSDITS
jgi:phospholipid/cholesterol/gamma-HCH transport system ATP-binding protein